MQIKINKIFDYAAIASGLILFFLAILTFCDVFGRRFLNSPVAGTIEIVEFGIALVPIWGTAHTWSDSPGWARGLNIGADLLTVHYESAKHVHETILDIGTFKNLPVFPCWT